MRISDYQLSDEQMKQTIHLGCDVTFGEVRLGVELLHAILIDHEMCEKNTLLQMVEMAIREKRSVAVSFLTWHRFDVQNALHSMQFVVEMWLLITTDQRLLPDQAASTGMSH